MSSTEEYIARLDAAPAGVKALTMSLVTERRALTDAECLEEALFTGLRLTDGIDLADVGARYGVDVWGKYGRSLEPFVGEGLLINDGRRLRFSREGMLLANEILQVFV